MSDNASGSQYSTQVFKFTEFDVYAPQFVSIEHRDQWVIWRLARDRKQKAEEERRNQQERDQRLRRWAQQEAEERLRKQEERESGGKKMG